jgi:hypothetical protein
VDATTCLVTGCSGLVGSEACGNRKWWLTPVVILRLLLGVLVVLGASGAARFIYLLF